MNSFQTLLHLYFLSTTMPFRIFGTCWVNLKCHVNLSGVDNPPCWRCVDMSVLMFVTPKTQFQTLHFFGFLWVSVSLKKSDMCSVNLKMHVNSSGLENPQFTRCINNSGLMFVTPQTQFQILQYCSFYVHQYHLEYLVSVQ